MLAAPAIASSQPSAFPVGDWQFWVVTTLAVVALIWLIGRLVPKRFFNAHRRRTKPATLTIGGKAVVPGSRAGNDR